MKKEKELQALVEQNKKLQQGRKEYENLMEDKLEKLEKLNKESI